MYIFLYLRIYGFVNLVFFLRIIKKIMNILLIIEISVYWCLNVKNRFYYVSKSF